MHQSENARLLTMEQLLGDPNEGTRPLERVISSRYSGLYAEGPFLKQGEVANWDLEVVPDEDFEVVLSFNQRPFGSVSDNLDVSVILPNGTRIDSNETLEGTEYVYLPASYLYGAEYVTIQVGAEVIGVGNISGALGSDGDMLGFALAVKGVSGVYEGGDSVLCNNGATIESGCTECPPGDMFDIEGLQCLPIPPNPEPCDNGATIESGCTECPSGEVFVPNVFQCLPIPPNSDESDIYQISGYDVCTRECEYFGEDRHELRVIHSNGTVLCSVILDHANDGTGETFVACPNITLLSGSMTVEVDAGWYEGMDWVVTITTPNGVVTTYNWRYLHDNGHYLGRGPSELGGTGECSMRDNRNCMADWQTLAFFGPEITDRDGDNVADEYDVFPNDSDEWWDSDRDGVPDNTDVFPLDGTQDDNDRDGDGIGDRVDNCKYDWNPDQLDMDGDGPKVYFRPTYRYETGGDVCDEDRDGDLTKNDCDVDPDDPLLNGNTCISFVEGEGLSYFERTGNAWALIFALGAGFVFLLRKVSIQPGHDERDVDPESLAPGGGRYAAHDMIPTSKHDNDWMEFFEEEDIDYYDKEDSD